MPPLNPEETIQTWNMRVLIQRVHRASVSAEGQVLGAIEKGLLVLLGVEEGDGPSDIHWLCHKISKQRIFRDDAGLMNLSVRDIQGGVLVVSQFTLLASTKKGHRPSFTRSASPQIAEKLYDDFLIEMSRALGQSVESGAFGADMDISLVNHGPVTIWMDSRQRE